VLVVGLAATVLVVVDEQNPEHKEQSGGIGKEQFPLSASTMET
jgi:hypothetical protein